MPAPGDAGVVPAAGPWTFDALVHAIVTTNPRIRAQVAAAGAARFDVSAAKWQYFPSPAVQAEAAGNDRQIIASVTQPLVTFGRLGADLRAAKSRATLANTRIDEARYQLAFRALELYGQLASAQRAEQVLRGDVARLSALGELISRRVTAGASAPVDLNLVLTRIRQSENAMISLRTRQQTARDALGELLGASVQGAEIIVPDGAALSPLMAETPQPDMVPQALSYSPVLRRAAGEIDVALTDKQRALGAVRGRLKPWRALA
jgi:adhesin transport system outer membrane protein